MSVKEIVEQIARMTSSERHELAECAIQQGIATELEFDLHVAQMEADNV